MASTLPVSVLLGEAADAEARRARLPSPRNVPIDHFVILMMENRSFDHYFGWVPNADATQRMSYRNPQGQAGAHAARLDPGHRAVAGLRPPRPRSRLGLGPRAAAGAASSTRTRGNDEFALCYYNRGELGFIHEAARQYTLYDRYFISLLASTWPNRYYKWSGQSGGKMNNTPPAEHGRQPVGDDLRPRDRQRPVRPLLRLGPALRGGLGPAGRRAGPTRSSATTPSARAGTLPNISIVDPPFRDGGGGDGLSADEHPLGDVRLGQAFMADVVNAFVELAQLSPRRDVHHLRRVGRVLRPRPPAAGDRRADEPRPRQGLRPDGLPRPGRGGVALRARRRSGPRASGWTTAPTATSRSSS